MYNWGGLESSGFEAVPANYVYREYHDSFNEKRMEIDAFIRFSEFKNEIMDELYGDTHPFFDTLPIYDRWEVLPYTK